MPKVPDEILTLAKAHHEQLIRLEKDARRRVEKVLERALGRIERDQTLRQFSGLENLQAAEVEILAKLTARYTGGDLEEALGEILEEGLSMAPRHAAAEVNAWLEYYGAEARPLNLAAIAESARETVIERIPASLARWGPDVARSVRNELSASIATKQFAGTTIDQIKGAIGAERWKADRIFRTELFTSYNKAHLDGITSARDDWNIPLKKSAIAFFDARTDEDSFPVHGQVRELEANFVDGDGRRFLHPPGRPNDREKEIPWIDEGEDLDLIPTDEGIAQAEAARARNAALAKKKSPPPRTGPISDPDSFEGKRERALLDWTSGSNSSSSVALKEAARREFGLDGQIWNPHDRVVEAQLDDLQNTLGRTYSETQAHYSGPRAGSVKLYRGVRSDVFVEGTVESWTDDPSVARRFAGRNGEVLVADIDTRRILSSVDAPGWRNGPYGDQREFVILSDPPKLAFEAGDWQSGSFRALDLDSEAVVSGPWGVLEDFGGRARLEHIPSGRTLLEGAEFTKSDLLEAAQYFDRSGIYDGAGITSYGTGVIDDALEVLKVQYAKAIPADSPGADVIEIFGERLGLVNQKVKPGKPGIWGRRSFDVVRNGADGYRAQEFRGVVQGNFGIATDKGGPGDGYFVLTHMKTGKPLFSGTRTFYGRGHRVPVDVGGFQLDHMKHLAGRLEPYFDETTGAVLEATKDDLDKILEIMFDEDPSSAITFAVDSNEDIDAWFDEALGLNEDDDFDPFGDFAGTQYPAPRGPSPSYADKARKSMSNRDVPELTPDEKFSKAVEEREASLRRGQYGRHNDPEFEKAVSEEVGRREREAARKRLEDFEEIGFTIDGEGRGFIPEPEAPAAPEYKPEDDPEEIKRKRAEADERARLEAEKRKATRLAAEKKEAEEAAKKEAEKLEKEREKAEKAAKKAAEKAEKEAAEAKELERKAKEAKRKRVAYAKKKAEAAEAKKAKEEAEAEAERIAKELEEKEKEAERLEKEQKKLEAEAKKARKAAKDAEAKAAADAAKNTVPEFKNTAAAEKYVTDNGVAKYAKFRRSWNKDGIREAISTVEDMTDRFDMPELTAIGDVKFFNEELSASTGQRFRGSRNAIASYGGDSLFVKKITFDSKGVNESMRLGNAQWAAKTDVATLVDKMKSRPYTKDAGDHLEKLAAQGWTDRHAIATSTERVLQHELGHRFHDTIKIVDADFDPMIRRLHREGWGTPIGRYASTVPDELAAESMVAYVNGEHYLLPDELIEAYAKHDKKAGATKALAAKKLNEWESGTKERLVRNVKRDADRIEAAAINLAEVERRNAIKWDRNLHTKDPTTEDFELYSQDWDEMIERLDANNPENPVGRAKFNAWAARRNEATRRIQNEERRIARGEQ